MDGLTLTATSFVATILLGYLLALLALISGD